MSAPDNTPSGAVEERADDVSRTRLDAIQHEIDQWVTRSLRILAVILVISLAGGTLSTFLFFRIQNAREDACEQRNLRHDAAVDSLRKDSDLDQKNAPNEAARAEIRRRRDVTIRLIDFLQPHTPNCNDA